MATIKKKLEKDIQREICEYLTERKLFFWRQNNIPVFGRNNAGVMTFRSMSKYTPKGLPDIMILRDGFFIGLEVKRPEGKLSEEQIEIQRQFINNGAMYHKVCSVEEVIKILAPFTIW